nr:uncharacterized protein LOC119176595 [Rhipicephalus microplus]
MATTDHFRKKRGSTRTGVTRELLSDLLQQPDSDASQINSHMDFLKDKEAALSRLDDVILVATNKEDMNHEVEAASKYNEKILYAVSRATFRLQELEKATRAQERATGSGPNNYELPHFGNAAGHVRAHRPLAVQLPQLRMPTFHGSLRGWLSYWDHFIATIRKNTELSRIEKFKYLLTYLIGSAERALEGIHLPEQNYNLAVKTLTDRFERQDLLVNENVGHLLELSPMKTSSHILRLRLLHDNLQFHVSALEGLGVVPDQYTVLLNCVLMRCLPEDLAVMYVQKLKESHCASSIAQTPDDRT